MDNAEVRKPVIPFWLLKIASQEDFSPFVVGDCEELYEDIFMSKGRSKAWVWLWSQVVRSVPFFIINSIVWSFIMVGSYVKSTVRYFKKQRIYSFINIAGLAIGMACCFLILLFIQNQLSYDRYHENADSIYRPVQIDGNAYFAGTPAPFGPVLKEKFPDVVNFCRLGRVSWALKCLVSGGENKYYEDKFFMADPSFFEIFNVPVVKGNPVEALRSPNSIVITQSVADKYFPYRDPMGKRITLDDKFDFTVEAVVQDMPANSHIHFKFLVPFVRVDDLYGYNYSEQWGASNWHTYVQLKKGADPAAFRNSLVQRRKDFPKRGPQFFNSLKFQKLTDIHFEPMRYNFEPVFDRKNITVFSAVALIVLLVACINFMNLSTAKSSLRAKEVGLRKVVGAYRSQLVRQFISESVLYAFTALLFSVLLVYLFIPVLNNITGFSLALRYDNITAIGGVLLLTVLVGVISGLYPAFYISAFEPAKVLKGAVKRGRRAVVIRNILVVFQFAISVALIAGAIIVKKQLDYIKTKNIGLDKSRIVQIPIFGKELNKQYEVIKEELRKIPNITNVSASRFLPTLGTWHQGTTWEGQNEDEPASMYWFAVDEDFIPTFDLQLIQGRNFSMDDPKGKTREFIVNESAVKYMNMDDPIGKKFNTRTTVDPGTIIGVVKDFNYQSLHKEVAPCVMWRSPRNYEYISVKIPPDNIPDTIAALKSVWSKFSNGVSFEYFFIDEDFDKLYKSETIMGSVISYFTFFSIIVACLGLFGLASFITEQRTKEIGIRKTMGATIPDITFLLVRDFVKWVLIANVFAWPIAYFMMGKWLENFAYRVDVGIGSLLISTGIAVMIALLTVSFQTIKTALLNPAKALKYE